MEIAGRADGLIPTNRIALADLVHHGGEPPEILADPLLERAPGIAIRLLALVDLSTADVFVIVSNSGVNRSIVDMAIESRQGAIQSSPSRRWLTQVPSPHGILPVSTSPTSPTGCSTTTHHLATRCCPWPTESTSAPSPRSPITFVVQMLVAEIVRRLEDTGDDVPVYMSANVPGGHEQNTRIEQFYSGRLRRWAI
jgi:uncharacterized phosphosugar-binding protein